MKQDEWLVLLHAFLSVSELLALRERFGEIAAIAHQTEQSLRNAGLPDNKARAIASPDSKAIDATRVWLENENHHIVAYGSDEYPEMLTQLAGAPLALFVNGDIDALHLPCLAIVGSRNPTRGGVSNAVEFSRHLARSGYAIVSGLAQGIDTAAHRGALDANGKTIAFLGHGIDRVYPAQNYDLAHQIAATGALVSEYPLGAPPDKWHFPERNRLISGLSLGTLVVEAARRSGSLITARLAAEQGREVFALPGSIHNPLARGCHELIRQGAKLVETAADINAELAPLAGHMQQNLTESTNNGLSLPADDDDYSGLRKLLSHDPTSIDELKKHSGLTIGELSSMLLILELHGEVESLSGGRYVLIA
ncbi:MAG: DNA-processing protein DprA [Gammaproteobacteria bacterium]|nr:DNA-processing protein DprA [Gammaproteobacteria bacterium]